jgi:hypothetical protein
MSTLPWPPARSELKNSVRPSSDIHRGSSFPGLLTTLPRLTGSCHAPPDLRDTQMSSPPWPPGRVEHM